MATACGHCGTDVSPQAQRCRHRYDHIDLPPIRPIVTRIELLGARCRGCGKRYRAAAPIGMVAGTPFGPGIRALLEACADDLPGLRDRALLSVAYDTGLRASELVAVAVEHIVDAIDPEARLLHIHRSKGDPEGKGATAYLSPRSVCAIAAWQAASGIAAGSLLRRVQVRRYKPRKAVPKRAVPARVDYDVGAGALHPGSIGPIWRVMIRRAFERGTLPDLTMDDVVRLLKGISAHSTQVGLNQDLFASGEDLAGIMDALRWKSPRMPLAYNRNLAAEQGAEGRLMAKLG